MRFSTICSPTVRIEAGGGLKMMGNSFKKAILEVMLLEDYRRTLIFAYVTGKKEVPTTHV